MYNGNYGSPIVPNTGRNRFKLELRVSNNNTTDSLIGSFATGKLTNALVGVEPVYETGLFELLPGAPTTQLKYVGVKPLDVKVTVSGNITSDSSSDSGSLAVEMFVAGSTLTGSYEKHSAGKLVGQTTVDVGFHTAGYARFTTNDVLDIQFAKDFVGTFVIANIILELRRLL